MEAKSLALVLALAMALWSLSHFSKWLFDVRLTAETERSAMLVSEVSELKEQVTSRDRVVMEVNKELECVQQQMTQLNTNYQATLHQQQLTQHAL